MTKKPSFDSDTIAIMKNPATVRLILAEHHAKNQQQTQLCGAMFGDADG